ncbi:MAG: hypothetical protein AAFX65_04535 [Cyanobacteria bacterium J06638_7]
MPPQRTLHLHAGPHKTGSTYLQARLQRNARGLEQLGLRYPTPWGEHSHRKLARALRQGRGQALDQLLRRQQRWSGDLLLSAEHFVPLLARPAALQQLRARAAAHGYGLHVINVVRPQDGLLNSFYGHALGRLYGSPRFPDYVRAQLAGRRLRGSARRRWMRMGPLALDFERRFAPLLEADGLRTTFLPFRPRRSDPFEQLIAAVGLPPGAWKQAPQDQANEQLGRRGLGLAYLLNQRLDELPLRRHRLIRAHGLNRLVEQVRARARQRGWVGERFSGWNGPLRRQLQACCDAANERFAQRVWGQAWQACFDGPEPARADAGLVLEPELRQEADQLFEGYRRRLAVLSGP